MAIVKMALFGDNYNKIFFNFYAKSQNYELFIVNDIQKLIEKGFYLDIF